MRQDDSTKKSLDDITDELDLLGQKNHSETEGFFGNIAKTLSNTVNKARGYFKKTIDDINSGKAKITFHEYADHAKDTIEIYLKDAKSAVMTDGKFDSAKVKELLHDSATTSKVYGAKFLNYLKHVSETGIETLQKDTAIFPDTEKMNSVYKGIGDRYQGILTVKDCDDCLKFYQRTTRLIPNNEQYYSVILEDVKSSASVNPQELIAFYDNLMEHALDHKGPLFDHTLRQKQLTVKRYFNLD